MFSASQISSEVDSAEEDRETDRVHLEVGFGRLEFVRLDFSRYVDRHGWKVCIEGDIAEAIDETDGKVLRDIKLQPRSDTGAQAPVGIGDTIDAEIRSRTAHTDTEIGMETGGGSEIAEPETGFQGMDGAIKDLSLIHI